MIFIPGNNISNHDFYDWCVERNVGTKLNVPGVDGGFYDYYLPYFFTEEYTFDISAKSITFEDSNNVTRKLPVSVAPVMDKEGSGGESEFPEVDEMFEKILMLVGILIVVVILGYITPVFKFVFNVIIKAIVFVISAPFKLIGNLFKSKKRKR